MSFLTGFESPSLDHEHNHLIFRIGDRESRFEKRVVKFELTASIKTSTAIYYQEQHDQLGEDRYLPVVRKQVEGRAHMPNSQIGILFSATRFGPAERDGDLVIKRSDRRTLQLEPFNHEMRFIAEVPAEEYDELFGRVHAAGGNWMLRLKLETVTYQPLKELPNFPGHGNFWFIYAELEGDKHSYDGRAIQYEVINA